jgi:hypothetical protein
MGLRSEEEEGWPREAILNLVPVSLASLQLEQRVPSSTTRMPLHSAVLLPIVACLGGL